MTNPYKYLSASLLDKLSAVTILNLTLPLLQGIINLSSNVTFDCDLVNYNGNNYQSI